MYGGRVPIQPGRPTLRWLRLPPARGLGVKLDELTPNEQDRLLAGRTDWREAAWQDHCGDVDCPQCSGFIPEGRPRLLSFADHQLRNTLRARQLVGLL